MNPTGRQTWKYKEEAKKYHKSHGYEPYTMIWNQTVEAEMLHKGLPKEMRVLAAVRRYAWGNLSDWAVDAMPAKTATDPKPRPLTQERLGEILAIPKSQMSDACIFLKDQGYLRKNHLYLYPEEKLSPLDSTKDLGVGSNSNDSRSPYLRFEQFLLERKPQIANTLSELDKERKRLQEQARAATKQITQIKRAILCLWRDVEREQKEKGEVEDLANCNLDHILESGSNSKMEKFLTPSPPAPESEPNSAKKPNKSQPTAKGSLKSLKLEREKRSVSSVETPSINEREDTTYDVSSLPPLNWRQGLAKAFTEAEKPQPTKAQSAAAYAAVQPHWEKFLDWLPTSSEFKRMEHPGGLPTLIQFFEAHRIAPKPVKKEKKTKFDEALEGLEAQYGAD